MKVSFNEASYLAQVRRLRSVATVAVSRYPIQAKIINFINHGENTTFRIDAKNGRKYLLRIHRTDYHTKVAIQEEMAWLAHLSNVGLSVPKPVPSKYGHLVGTVTHPNVSVPRNCSVFEWIEGRFIEKSVNPKHLYQVGRLLAEFQKNAPRTPVLHRRYWTSEGLVGPNSKFGSIDSLAGIPPKQQAIITKGRKLVFHKLRRFEKKFPKRQGLIHADLHFGNILAVGKNLGAIDFDDCGQGFYAYDLVIPLLSVQGTLGENKRDGLPAFYEAMISGYKTKMPWDQNDEEIFPYLCTARRLTMLGWLNSRSDNPRLKKILKGSVERTLKHLKSEYEIA